MCLVVGKIKDYLARYIAFIAILFYLDSQVSVLDHVAALGSVWGCEHVFFAHEVSWHLSLEINLYTISIVCH